MLTPYKKERLLLIPELVHTESICIFPCVCATGAHNQKMSNMLYARGCCGGGVTYINTMLGYVLLLPIYSVCAWSVAIVYTFPLRIR